MICRRWSMRRSPDIWVTSCGDRWRWSEPNCVYEACFFWIRAVKFKVTVVYVTISAECGKVWFSLWYNRDDCCAGCSIERFQITDNKDNLCWRHKRRADKALDNGNILCRTGGGVRVSSTISSSSGGRKENTILMLGSFTIVSGQVRHQ